MRSRVHRSVSTHWPSPPPVAPPRPWRAGRLTALGRDRWDLDCARRPPRPGRSGRARPRRSGGTRRGCGRPRPGCGPGRTTPPARSRRVSRAARSSAGRGWRVVGIAGPSYTIRPAVNPTHETQHSSSGGEPCWRAHHGVGLARWPATAACNGPRRPQTGAGRPSQERCLSRKSRQPHVEVPSAAVVRSWAGPGRRRRRRS